MITPAELRERAEALSWFHTMDLGQGVVTRGIDPTPEKLETLRLPKSFSGKSVLDIGAWDGFFTYEAERRGAERVLSVDSFCWSGEGWGTKAGYELAHEAYQSKAESREMEVEAISAESVGTFDVVFFLGVLYHLRHPLLALEKVASVTNERLVLETEVDLMQVSRPALAFYAGTELNRDPTNWWAPNPSGLVAMLRAVGFSRIEVVHQGRALPGRVARAVWQKLKENKSIRDEYQRDRMVVHAFKE